VTQVGHVLTGAAIGVSIMPKRASAIQKSIHMFIFVLLANIPDIPMINWGHEKYFYSHSIFVNLLFILLCILGLTFSKRAFKKIGGWPVLIGGTLAWLSHLLLDSFYNHGLGVLILWPVSTGRLILPIPWLAAFTSFPPPSTAEMVLICIIEFLTFAPFLLLAILVRMFDIDLKVMRMIPNRIQNEKTN
jgi:hypothetical protein